MTTALKRRRGTDTNHNTFTGLEGEITVNTTNNSLHVHDGTTAGGYETMRTNFANANDIATDLNLSGTNTLTFNTVGLSLQASGNSGHIESQYEIETIINGVNQSTTTSSGVSITNLTATNLEVPSTGSLVFTGGGTEYASIENTQDDLIIETTQNGGIFYHKGYSFNVWTGAQTYLRETKLTIGPTYTHFKVNPNQFRRTIPSTNNISTEMIDVYNASTTSYGWMMKFSQSHQYYSPTCGIIGINGISSTGYLYIGNGRTSTSQSYLKFGSNAVIPANYLGNQYDNAIALGTASARFDDAYVTNGVTTGSDRNLKQDIEELSEAEQRVAVACKSLIRKYRWRDAFEQKGEDARIHVGIIAQDLEDAFTAEGLDPARYGMFCSDTYWWKDVIAPEQEKETVDENGITHTETIPETTTREVYDTESDAPDGATKVTTRSVRYVELLAFIISAM